MCCAAVSETMPHLVKTLSWFGVFFRRVRFAPGLSNRASDINLMPNTGSLYTQQLAVNMLKPMMDALY